MNTKNKESFLPVFNIENFEDYNPCREFENNFYVRPFNDHIKTNRFINIPHSHDFFLVLYVTKGSGTHKIDFNEYNVDPGAMFVLSPGQVHLWQLSDDIDGFVMFFQKEYFLIDFSQDRLNKMTFFSSSFSSPYLFLDEDYSKIISGLFENILFEYENRQLQFHDMIRMYLNTMFIFLTRLHQEQEKIKFNHKYEVIQLNKFLQFIDLNFKNHISVSDYADMMNITPKQLSSICKKSIDKSPLELIHQRIILETKRLLIHSHLSVNAIAEELKFSDPSYFIRLFKKNCGLTPEKFRSEQ